MATESFLRRYLKLNSGTEIPELFALWSGLSALSCTVGRRVHLDMGVYKVFPNLYTLLVAGSGRCRKSTAIGVMENLVYALEPKPNIVAQRITPEGLIDAIRITEPDASGTDVEERCEGFVLADELSTFLNKKTYEAGLAPLLISLWDCKEHFEYRTKSRGAEVVKNSCLGLLAASTVDWIRHAIPEDAIGGGLTSRFIFVYVEIPPPPVALTQYEPWKDELKDELVRELAAIRTLNGKMMLAADSVSWFEKSYNDFYDNSPFFEDKCLSGYASRRHVNQLKLAMLLAVSGGLMTIEVRHLETADALLVKAEQHMPKVLSLILSSEKGNLTESVYRTIARKSSGGLGRNDLIRSFSHKLSSKEMQEIIDTLAHSGRIKSEARDGTVFYISLRA